MLDVSPAQRRYRHFCIALLVDRRLRVITESGTFTLDINDGEEREIARFREGRIEIKPRADWDWFPVVDHFECAWTKDVM